MVLASHGLSMPDKGDTFERDFNGWNVTNSSWTRRRLTEIEDKVGRLPPTLDSGSKVSE